MCASLLPANCRAWSADTLKNVLGPMRDRWQSVRSTVCRNTIFVNNPSSSLDKGLWCIMNTRRRILSWNVLGWIVWILLCERSNSMRMWSPLKASLWSSWIWHSRRYILCKLTSPTARKASLGSECNSLLDKSMDCISELRWSGTVVSAWLVHSATFLPEAHLHLQTDGQLLQSESPLAILSTTNSNHQQSRIFVTGIKHTVIQKEFKKM